MTLTAMLLFTGLTLVVSRWTEGETQTDRILNAAFAVVLTCLALCIAFALAAAVIVGVGYLSDR